MGHVGVFQMGSVGTPIIGRPRPSHPPRHASQTQPPATPRIAKSHYSVREDRIAPVGVASFLLGSVATLVVVVALTALLDPRLPPIVSVGTPFLVVGAWRAIDGYRFVHTHDMSDEAIHERDLRMLELNQPTEKVAAPPGRTLRERLANRRAGFRQPLR
ncbi:conserved protein [Propionibacterium freudenreichii subsp. shermanii]|nr:conserved protein [Propionibacterium freudenreichii subsp. shermanii]